MLCWPKDYLELIIFKKQNTGEALKTRVEVIHLEGTFTFIKEISVSKITLPTSGREE